MNCDHQDIRASGILISGALKAGTLTSGTLMSGTLKSTTDHRSSQTVFWVCSGQYQMPMSSPRLCLNVRNLDVRNLHVRHLQNIPQKTLHHPNTVVLFLHEMYSNPNSGLTSSASQVTLKSGSLTFGTYINPSTPHQTPTERVGHAFREPLLNPSGMEGMLIWGAGGKLMFREGPGQLCSHHFPHRLMKFL